MDADQASRFVHNWYRIVEEGLAKDPAQGREIARERADDLLGWLKGGEYRLRPVLMTAITTLVGLVPLAFSRFTVANAYIDSLAIVVIGGLSTSTLFTLLALPVWYTALEDMGVLFLRALPKWERKTPDLGRQEG